MRGDFALKPGKDKGDTLQGDCSCPKLMQIPLSDISPDMVRVRLTEAFHNLTEVERLASVSALPETGDELARLCEIAANLVMAAKDLLDNHSRDALSTIELALAELHDLCQLLNKKVS